MEGEQTSNSKERPQLSILSAKSERHMSQMKIENDLHKISIRKLKSISAEENTESSVGSWDVSCTTKLLTWSEPRSRFRLERTFVFSLTIFDRFINYGPLMDFIGAWLSSADLRRTKRLSGRRRKKKK